MKQRIYLDCEYADVSDAPQYEQITVPVKAVINGLIEDETDGPRIIREVLKNARIDPKNHFNLTKMLLKDIINYFIPKDHIHVEALKLAIKVIENQEKLWDYEHD